MKEIKTNELGNIGIRFNEDSKTYLVFCNCIISEERAYKFGESCYRTKNFKYKKCAERLFDKLIKMDVKRIINNQDRLFD